MPGSAPSLSAAGIHRLPRLELQGMDDMDGGSGHLGEDVWGASKENNGYADEDRQRKELDEILRLEIEG